MKIIIAQVYSFDYTHILFKYRTRNTTKMPRHRAGLAIARHFSTRSRFSQPREEVVTGEIIIIIFALLKRMSHALHCGGYRPPLE